MRERVKGVAAFGLAAVLGVASTAGAAADTERVSVGPGGVEGDDRSESPSITVDGGLVAFHSDATNLVPDDTNFVLDVFVRARSVGPTTRQSVATGGFEANGNSFEAAISPGGFFVAFTSEATNLVPGDTNGAFDVFVRDRDKRTTERVSVGLGGSQADGASTAPGIATLGSFVSFESDATNLVAGDTNRASDVFVRDRTRGTTERVSIGPGGAQGNADSSAASISMSGSFVAFASNATNLVPGDTNASPDIFVRDRGTGATERVSVGPGGAQANGASFSAAISPLGRYVAFASFATNLVVGDSNGFIDIFVRDRETGTTERVNVGPGGAQANGDSDGPSIASGGRVVAFTSSASNLVAGDTNRRIDTFARNRETGVTERVSVSSTGAQGNDQSLVPTAVSADGTLVGFGSAASALVPNDRNNRIDVFARELPPAN